MDTQKPAAKYEKPKAAATPSKVPAASQPAVVAAAPPIPVPAATPKEQLAEPKVELIPAPPLPQSQIVNAAAAAPTPAPSAAPALPAPAVPATPAPAKQATTKVTSLTEQIRVRTVLDQADALMKTGDVTKARAQLQDAARGDSPDLLTALAATYDPIVLLDYPRAQSAADAKRASELYAVAAGKGSKSASDRLAKLKIYMERTGK
jgi:hypothetical protein